MTKRYQRWLFRLLILISCLSPLLVSGIDKRYSLLPDTVYLFIVEHSNELSRSPLAMETIAGTIYVILGIVSIIGLLIFWNPARIIFTVYVVFGLLASLYMPVVIASAIKSSMMDFVNVLQGILLAVLYTAPVKHLFDKSPSG